MDNNFMEIRKKDLENKISKLSDAIRYNTDKQTKLLEYNQYNRNTHVALGTIIGITSFFITKRILDLNLLASLTTTLLAATATSLTTKLYVNIKRNKLKKQNPNISFETESIDKNYEKINDLFEQKFLLVEELGSVNTEIKQNNIIEEEKIIESKQNIIEKVKVKTLKRM